MGANQVAAIRPAIAELEADEQVRTPHSPARYFARFSHPPHGSPWIEVYLESGTVVNVCYPFETEPLTYLEKLRVSPFAWNASGGPGPTVLYSCVQTCFQ